MGNCISLLFCKIRKITNEFVRGYVPVCTDFYVVFSYNKFFEILKDCQFLFSNSGRSTIPR
jgi:hypothetical protein